MIEWYWDDVGNRQWFMTDIYNFFFIFSNVQKYLSLDLQNYMSVLLIFYTYLYIIYNACIISLLNAICIWYVNHVSTYGLETKKSFEVGHCLCFIITSCGPMHMPPISSFLGIVIDWWHLASNSICSFPTVLFLHFLYKFVYICRYLGLVFSQICFHRGTNNFYIMFLINHSQSFMLARNVPKYSFLFE